MPASADVHGLAAEPYTLESIGSPYRKSLMQQLGRIYEGKAELFRFGSSRLPLPKRADQSILKFCSENIQDNVSGQNCPIV